MFNKLSSMEVLRVLKTLCLAITIFALLAHMSRADDQITMRKIGIEKLMPVSSKCDDNFVVFSKDKYLAIPLPMLGKVKAKDKIEFHAKVKFDSGADFVVSIYRNGGSKFEGTDAAYKTEGGLVDINVSHQFLSDQEGVRIQFTSNSDKSNRMKIESGFVVTNQAGGPIENTDWRNFDNGELMQRASYVDSPKLVPLADGRTLVLYTSANGSEGASDQKLGSLVMDPTGKSWTCLDSLPDFELLNWTVVDRTRVDEKSVTIIAAHKPSTATAAKFSSGTNSPRYDLLGYLAEYTFDLRSMSWSKGPERPLPKTSIDEHFRLTEDTGYFWLAADADRVGDQTCLPISKVGNLRQNSYLTYENTEPILTCGFLQPFPIAWDAAPLDGKIFHCPDNDCNVTEEPIVLSAKDSTSFSYLFFRTNKGKLAYVSTEGNSRVWSEPMWAEKADGSGPLNNPRSFAFVGWLADRRPFILFSNHTGVDFYERNPVFISIGEETGAGQIKWNTPDVLMYAPINSERLSYFDARDTSLGLSVVASNKVEARSMNVPGEWLSRISSCHANSKQDLTVQYFQKLRASAQIFSIIDSHSVLKVGVKGFNISFSLDDQASDPGADSDLAFIDGVTQKKRFSVKNYGAGKIAVTLNFSDDPEANAKYLFDFGQFEGGKNIISVDVDTAAGVIRVFVNGHEPKVTARAPRTWYRLEPFVGDYNLTGVKPSSDVAENFTIFNEHLVACEIESLASSYN
jgi:hypothetical protein